MPTAYILVGIPGSGKTTWVGHRKTDWDTTVFVSTDKFVDQEASNQNKTYSEVFNDSMQAALTKMINDVIDARSAGKDIIWDQTSTTIQSRKRKFNMLPIIKQPPALIRITLFIRLMYRCFVGSGNFVKSFMLVLFG